MADPHPIDTMVAAGRAAYPDFDDRSSFVAAIAGNLNEFRDAVAELPDGHHVVAALADDPERATEILRQRGVKMGTALGRFAAAARAKATPSAAAPKAPAAPDLHDPEMPMRDWTAAMDGRQRARREAAKTAPGNGNLYDPSISDTDFNKVVDRMMANRQARRRVR